MSESRHGLPISITVTIIAAFPSLLALHFASWPFLAVWSISCGIRRYFGDGDVLKDVALFGVISGVLFRENWLEWMNERHGSSFAAKFLLSTVLYGVVIPLWHYAKSHLRGPGDTPKKLDEVVAPFTVEHPKSLIFPCNTSHARVFPRRHTFEYSYLLFGIPITPAGTGADGTYVGDGSDKSKGNWWLQVRAIDYLERGYGEYGFYGKLQKYLRDHDVPDSEWSHAYLVTAPRFFGYSFNPVSFWYIYDQKHELKRMILEVNNTFGERRIYLLDGTLPGAAQPPTTKTKFTDMWTKDFHVSPFNSRKGSYALKALDPFPTPDFSEAAIDNTITLKSSKEHAKIVARVYSTGPPVAADHLGLLGSVQFITGWWWVGLVTFPRILREAAKLFFARGLNVWFRPEILCSSISRAPTSDEATLQKTFLRYLQYLVDRSPELWKITYHTAIPDHPVEMIASSNAHGGETKARHLELRVLTPVFYSRFVHYAHTSEALDRECLFTEEKNRTIWISHPQLLPLLLPQRKDRMALAAEAESGRAKRNRLGELRWTGLRILRCAPAEQAYSGTPRSPSVHVDDIRAVTFSDLDAFVRSWHGRAVAGDYRRTATKTFLAKRFAFGFTEVLDGLDLALRTLLIYAGMKILIRFDGEAQRYPQFPLGVLGSAPKGEDADIKMLWWPLLALGSSFCACHVYAGIKGYR
jgi:DUF1365 family protein